MDKQKHFQPVYGDGVFLAGDGYIAPLPGELVPNALEVMAWPSMTEPCGEKTLPWSTYQTETHVVLRFPPWLMLMIGAQAFSTAVLAAVTAFAAWGRPRRP